MKISSVLSALSSGTLLYLVMAACSASDGSRGTSSGAAGSEGGASSGSVVDGMVGNAVNPVPSASAAPGVPAPTVSVEQCDKTYAFNGTTYRYAEHSYPGSSIAEMASVRVLVSFPAGTSFPTGYSTLVTNAYVKDGAASFPCGEQTSLTFVKP